MGDITGPPQGLGMFGYGDGSQKTNGIHLRLYSRAFIIANTERLNNRIVYVTIETGNMAENIRLNLIRKLKKKYGDLYHEGNIMISSTHSHSTPGGYSQYLMFQLTSLGFAELCAETIASGIYNSIRRAHLRLKESYILMGKDALLKTSVNRSPFSYNQNPASERAKYVYNVDKKMTLLKFVSKKTFKATSLLNWFAVHGTSMNKTNKLISSDNKGYAAYLNEKLFNDGALPGNGDFISAYAPSNLGDSSPNTRGARCENTDLPCSFTHSSCNNNERTVCLAKGPGHKKGMEESTRIIGERQFLKAMDIFNKLTINKDRLENHDVQWVYNTVKMNNYEFEQDGTYLKTCEPALGFSFGAGTTDGTGDQSLFQGYNSTSQTEHESKFTKFRAIATAKPTKEQIKCHEPKPILFNFDKLNTPYLWEPLVVDIQIFKIGNLIILGTPGEFTTMAGRRLRNAVLNILGDPKLEIVISGLTNAYSHYITTSEEYQVQRYEGASTLYGPNTLGAYIDAFKKLALQLKENPSPPLPLNITYKIKDFSDECINIFKPHYFDALLSFNHTFGTTQTEVEKVYFLDDPKPIIVFGYFTADPNTDLLNERTYFSVEKYDDKTNRWVIVRTDADWDTKITFKGSFTDSFGFIAHVYWDLSYNAIPGIYRITAYGTNIFAVAKHAHYARSNHFTIYDSKSK